MKLKKIVAFMLCVVMVCSCISVNAAGSVQIFNPIDTTNGEVVADFYDKLLNYIIKHYRYDVTKEELLTAAVDYVLTNNPELLEDFGKGAFEALDENSMFYNAEEFEARLSDVTGQYVGIGIHVYQDEDMVILGEAIPGSPAENAGFEVGDVVIAVNGEDVRGYGIDKTTSLIKGEEGTSVTIKVLRNGKEYEYTLARATIKVNPVTYEILPGTNIGYVKISSFNDNATEEFDKAMIALGDQGVKKVILDLRNNLGGNLNAAVAVASYFVPTGKLIVTQEYKDSKKNKKYYSENTKYKFKGAVLINEYSASASEIVAGTLKDYKTVKIVGKVSYGKGTVQTYDILRSNQYMWYTIAEYYTPSHNTIHKVGIKPDYSVTNRYVPFDMNSLVQYEITRDLPIGSTGDDVYAVKSRLAEIGYIITVNGVYDQKTADIVSKFQEAVGLPVTGVADVVTQININDTLKEAKVLDDRQLEKAKEIVAKMK